MSQNAYQILNRILWQIDTAETGWMAYKEACIPAFDGASDLYKQALKDSKGLIAAKEEAMWKLLNLLLIVSVGPWVPRLLAPLQGEIDKLAAVWVKDTLKVAIDETKDLVKGTLLDDMKNVAVGRTSDPFEPVVEKTINWGSRLAEGIYKRSLKLKDAMNAILKESDKWSVAAATSLEQAFLNHCPFITDMPTDTGDEFKKNFQNDSETEMWAAWAGARNVQWWKDNPRHKHLWDMYPILDRMNALGVHHLVSAWIPPGRGTTIASARPRGGYILDMLRFIEWAKQPRTLAVSKSKNSKPIWVPEWLKVKPTPIACYVGDGHR